MTRCPQIGYAGTHYGYKAHAFMLIALGKPYEETMTYFDRMRNKRNRAIDDVAGLITETEARNLFEKATEYVEFIRSTLAGKA